MERLGRDFFERRTETVARDLIGRVLVAVVRGKRRAGVIVETEAYLGVRDRAAHTFGGRRTERTEPMWMAGGTAYVYFTYGMHHCMNLSTAGEGVPEAVLIRALEPVEGVEAMRRARGGKKDLELCSGPARLCAALGIDRRWSGLDTPTSDRLWVEPGDGSKRRLGVTARVGIESAGEWATRPLRYFDAGSAHVSKGRPSTGKGPKRGRGA